MISDFKTILFLLTSLVVMKKGFGFPMIEMPDRLQKHSESFVKNATHCMDKVGLSESDVANFMRNTIPSSKAGHCFVACMMEKGGIIENGEFNFKQVQMDARNALGDEDTLAFLIGEVVEACAKSTKGLNDNCQMAEALSKCAEDYVSKFRSEVKKSL